MCNRCPLPALPAIEFTISSFDLLDNISVISFVLAESRYRASYSQTSTNCN